MIKLFCSDFDNTLAKGGRILPENVLAIRQLQAAGVTFALVSGRHLSNCRKKLDSKGIVCPVVASNGAIAVDPEDQVLGAQPLPPEVSAKLYQLSADHHWFFLAYGRDSAYLPWYHNWVGKIPPVYLATYAISRTKLRLFPKPGPGKPVPEIYKFAIYPPKKDLWSVRQDFVDMAGVQAVWSDSSKVELQAEGVTKIYGVNRLMAALGLEKNEVCAIGDHNNDLDMLAGVGLGLAVGNAVEELKDQADKIFAPVDQGGFAQACAYVIQRNEEESCRLS